MKTKPLLSLLLDRAFFARLLGDYRIITVGEQLVVESFWRGKWYEMYRSGNHRRRA